MDMIEGLHFDVTSEELKEHCRKQVGEYAKKIENRQKMIYDFGKSVLPEQINTSSDPRDSWGRKLEFDKEDRLMFEWLENHVVADTIYRLRKRELAELNII